MAVISHITLLEILIGLLVCWTTRVFATDEEIANSNTILFVTVPARSRFQPLLALAEGLARKGYHVRFALPSPQVHWLDSSSGVEPVPVGRCNNTADNIPLDWFDFLSTGNLSDVHVFAGFQDVMFHDLDVHVRDNPSYDLMVVDRYAFAGFDVAHKHDLPYVVHNPSMLLDLDQPPGYVPAPYAHVDISDGVVWSRLLNFLYRLRYRSSMMNVVHRINTVRERHRLFPVRGQHDLYGNRLVISSSVFGIEHARALDPLFHLTGPILSPNNPGDNPAPPPDQRVFTQWMGIQDGAVDPFVVVDWGDAFARDADILETFILGCIDGGFRVAWVPSFYDEDIATGHMFQDEKVKLIVKNPEFFLVLPDSLDLRKTLELIQRSKLRPSKIPVVARGDVYSVFVALIHYHPLLTIPHHANQRELAQRVERAGAGIRLRVAQYERNRNRFVTWLQQSDKDAPIATPASVASALEMICKKPRYFFKSEHLGKILQVSGGLERAILAVDLALQVGADRLVPIEYHASWFQRAMLDVYAVYFVVIMGVYVVAKTCLVAYKSTAFRAKQWRSSVSGKEKDA